MKKQLLFEFNPSMKNKTFSLFVLIYMVMINISHAQLNTWIGGTSTNFLDAANWSTAAPPATFLAGTTFSIGAGSPNNPTLSTNYPGTTSGGLTVTPTGVLTTNGNMNLGGSSSYTYIDGQLTVTGGNFNGRGNLYIGNSTTSTSATVNIQTGGTVNVKNVAYVGRNRTGTVNINGGTFSVENQTTGGVIIGTSSATSAGVVNINSGALRINKPAGITINASGTVNIDAGSIILKGNQTTIIANHIANSKIKLTGNALVAGKIITSSYDTATDLTTVVAVNTTTWNGTTWTNNTPTIEDQVIIESPYSTTTNGAIVAKKIIINTGGSLTINSGTNVTVQNEVINNLTADKLVIENNANLIQVNSAINQGNIIVNRNSNALSRLDYTMWSSPVVGQNLVTFSPLTSQSPSRFYTYDSATNLYSTVASPTTTNFVAGTGYLIRMPNTAVTAPATETFAGQFIGVPNNGPIGFTGLTSDAFYAVGNPYPSTISANLFLTANNANGTLYFWRKTNGTGSAYAVYNTLGGTAASTTSEIPNGTIQVGQGFIVKTGAAATTLNFTNAMRTANNDNKIFRTKAVEKNRIWLNLTNNAGAFSQALVGYIDGATQGVDEGIDGAYINDSPVALTSNINGQEYTIQGRPAFDASDVVALNFKTDVAGDYTIAIDHTDGLFAAGQDVYLVDSATGTETNLKTDAYTFTATTGTAASRFSLKYQKTLGVDAPAFNENNVAVYKNNGTLYVNSGANAISNIKVFDIQGRLIAEQKNVNTTSTSIKNLKANQQVLIVKVTSQDNKVVNKKVVN